MQKASLDISDLRLTSKILTEKQKICVCRFLFKLRSKKVVRYKLFVSDELLWALFNEWIKRFNWIFRYRWYRIWMVTQETCVLLVELPTGNINAVLLLDEGNLLWLIVFILFIYLKKVQIFVMLARKAEISWNTLTLLSFSLVANNQSWVYESWIICLFLKSYKVGFFFVK